MKINTLFLWPVAFGILLSSTCVTRAVEPVTIDEKSRVNWSSPINDEFDGLIVYDKHSVDDQTIVSSWSKQAIQLTVSKEFSQLTGYRRVRPSKTSKDTKISKDPDNCTYEEEPIYTKYTQNYRISNITISINGQLYKYYQGAVSRQLAQALANAPTSKNVRIRILTDNGFTVDSEIGVGTVKAWRQIFR
jgi:hypothetical protein